MGIGGVDCDVVTGPPDSSFEENAVVLCTNWLSFNVQIHLSPHHARECQPILQDHLLRSVVHIEKQKSLRQVYLLLPTVVDCYVWTSWNVLFWWQLWILSAVD